MGKGLYMGTNSIEFHRRFQSDDDCYEYLSELKWSQAYVCEKCGGSRHCKGKKPFSRRCIKCSYDESPTAHTGFEKCKFSLLVAFHIVFKISTKKKGMSSIELSNEFSLRQKTCWAFKRKIQTVMKSSQTHPLTGIVHVDEFLIGEYEQGVVGRSHNSKKRLVIVALEIIEKGVGRAYAQVIERASAKEFKPFFNAYISQETQVITDEWKGYLPLMKDYKKLEQRPSNKGANFKELHIHIMNIQGWLRGIHHHCDKENLQGYVDEYHFRYNRRSMMGSIFNLTLQKLIFNNVR
ncbi:MAG: IS1595 family transposase [Parabacteroides sp.]|nr:IS1595 family transposase [Parabacteroides sp.]